MAKWAKKRLDDASGYEFWEGPFGLIYFRKYDERKPLLCYAHLRAIATKLYDRVVLMQNYGDFLD